MKTGAKLWVGMAILIVLVPLGLIVPAYFKSGSAWGEWSADEVGKLAGYIPEGLEKLSGMWKAPFSGYKFGSMHSGAAYIISAVVGIGVTIILIAGIGKIFVKKGD